MHLRDPNSMSGTPRSRSGAETLRARHLLGEEAARLLLPPGTLRGLLERRAALDMQRRASRATVQRACAVVRQQLAHAEERTLAARLRAAAQRTETSAKSHLFLRARFLAAKALPQHQRDVLEARGGLLVEEEEATAAVELEPSPGRTHGKPRPAATPKQARTRAAEAASRWRTGSEEDTHTATAGDELDELDGVEQVEEDDDGSSVSSAGASEAEGFARGDLSPFAE